LRKSRNMELLSSFNTVESQFEFVERKSPVNKYLAKPQGKSRKSTFHAALPMEFIPPKDFMDKIAAKAIANDNCIRIEVNNAHVYDVKVCLVCPESICINKPDCVKKAQVHATLQHLSRTTW